LGESTIEEKIVELGKRIHLAQWQENRQRIALAASLQAMLMAAGIQCMFLKGMALLCRFYGDTGLRAMGDVDFLVRPEDAVNAADALTRAGWIAEEHLAPDEIRGQMRVRHAWQFSAGAEENCDMHWHPVVRCYAPHVAEAFWKDAEGVDIGGGRALVPCATDQLFHVCAHGLQWSWTPQTRWIPDAMTIFATRAPIDWRRLYELASAACMTVRIHAALHYLRARLDAPVPEGALSMFAGHRAAAWERGEYDLLQKSCPLGAIDSVRWHITNFRRIRPHDYAWRTKSVWLAFPEYLRAFLRTGGMGELATSLWRALRCRSKRLVPNR
jgi:hypothetical protein